MGGAFINLFEELQVDKRLCNIEHVCNKWYYICKTNSTLKMAYGQQIRKQQKNMSI